MSLDDRLVQPRHNVAHLLLARGLHRGRQSVVDLLAQSQARRQIREVLVAKLLLDPPHLVVRAAEPAQRLAGAREVLELAPFGRFADPLVDPALEPYLRRPVLAHACAISSCSSVSCRSRDPRSCQRAPSRTGVGLTAGGTV